MDTSKILKLAAAIKDDTDNANISRVQAGAARVMAGGATVPILLNKYKDFKNVDTDIRHNTFGKLFKNNKYSTPRATLAAASTYYTLSDGSNVNENIHRGLNAGVLGLGLAEAYQAAKTPKIALRSQLKNFAKNSISPLTYFGVNEGSRKLMREYNLKEKQAALQTLEIDVPDNPKNSNKADISRLQALGAHILGGAASGLLGGAYGNSLSNSLAATNALYTLAAGKDVDERIHRGINTAQLMAGLAGAAVNAKAGYGRFIPNALPHIGFYGVNEAARKAMRDSNREDAARERKELLKSLKNSTIELEYLDTATGEKKIISSPVLKVE